MDDPAIRHSDNDGRYGEGSVAYLVGKPVDLGKLGQELAAAHSWQEPPGLICDGSIEQATQDARVTLWIQNPDAVPATVKSIVGSHDPA